MSRPLPPVMAFQAYHIALCRGDTTQISGMRALKASPIIMME
jgi:hypothetical protein